MSIYDHVDDLIQCTRAGALDRARAEQLIAVVAATTETVSCYTYGKLCFGADEAIRESIARLLHGLLIRGLIGVSEYMSEIAWVCGDEMMTNWLATAGEVKQVTLIAAFADITERTPVIVPADTVGRLARCLVGAARARPKLLSEWYHRADWQRCRIADESLYDIQEAIYTLIVINRREHDIGPFSENYSWDDVAALYAAAADGRADYLRALISKRWGSVNRTVYREWLLHRRTVAPKPATVLLSFGGIIKGETLYNIKQSPRDVELLAAACCQWLIQHEDMEGIWISSSPDLVCALIAAGADVCAVYSDYTRDEPMEWTSRSVVSLLCRYHTKYDADATREIVYGIVSRHGCAAFGKPSGRSKKHCTIVRAKTIADIRKHLHNPEEIINAAW